jgi:ribonuclease T1
VSSIRTFVTYGLAFLLGLSYIDTDARGDVGPKSNQSVSIEISVTALPPEAQQTLQLIKRGGPYPYQRDGVAFGNYERLLPQRVRGYYREYTVPPPGAKNRGARRIVAGRDGEYYYSDDHYRSFRRVRE